MQLEQLKKDIEQKRGQLKQLQLEQNRFIELEQEILIQQQLAEKTRTIIQLVAQQTQSKVKVYVSDIVTSALEMILEEPYEFLVEFIQRRNKTECDLLFSRNGFKVNPLDNSGGGAVNVASFALRAALLMLSTQDKVIIADEPFHFLHSKVLHSRVAQLLDSISKQNKIQMIIVSGEEESEELVALADKVFKVVNRRGISYVKEL